MSATTSRICEDLVVVELGVGNAATSEVGMLLADNGARVLKIEPPGGDPFRERLPSGWLVWNRGKESVVADLATEAGRERVRSLVAGADVVVEGLRAGQADACGLGYERVRRTNPSLVYGSIKGFGASGPYANVPAYDALVMAKAGAFARGDFGFREGPIFSGALVASNGAAHMAVSGILAALIVRDRSGIGQRVDTSLYQGLNPIDYFVSYLVQLGAKQAAAGSKAQKTVAVPAAPPATRYMVSASTRDGRWLFFSPQLPNQAAALMRVLGLDELTRDERFQGMPVFRTAEDADAWEGLICERVKTRDLAEWIERAEADDDLPFEAVLSAEQALDHPQMRANGHVVVVNDEMHGPIEQVGPVGNFGLTPSRIERSAPALDAHGPPPARKAAPAATGSLPRHPLEGITIVEFGYFYAMPFGVTLAAALGARVIKIENLAGDPMRWSFGPPEWGAAKTMEGKESIAVDLRTSAGLGVMTELLRRADVFVHGFRPGVGERLGVTYAALQKINPSLLYVHGAGYGASGPYAHRPIYAGTAAAAAGSVHRQAAHWLDRELNAGLDATAAQALVAPRLRNLTDGDANAAVGVLSAILFGLRHRARTGQGQLVTTSMLGGNAMAYADDFNRYRGKRPVRQADPEQLGLSATYRLYRTNQGWVFLAIPSQEEWECAMRVLGRDDLRSDPRFASPASRDRHDEVLASELEKLFGDRAAHEWEDLLLPAGVGCVAVSARPQAEVAVSDPALREMGLVVEIEHPLFGALLRYGPPALLSETPGRVAPGCTFAQHTRAILGELGYGSDEIEALAAERVVRLAE